MKFLVIRFSSIGDIVLTTPVVRCLKQQVPDAEVHFLTKASFRSVVASNPYIDKCHYLENDLQQTIKALKEESFDYLIDLHRNLRTLRVKYALDKPSFSFDKLNLQKWLLVNLKLNLLPGKHIVDRYLDTVRTFGVKNDGAGLDYFIPKEEELKTDDLPASHHAGYIGIVIGAALNTKKYPVHKWKEYLATLNHPVILLGGKEDAADGAAIAAIDPVKIYNACGKFKLNESAAIVRQAKFIITNDTGLMHIAAAFKKPIISLWGNTVPEFGMYPYYGNSSVAFDILEIKKLWCRPCSKIGYKKCPLGHFKCMEKISVEAITTSSVHRSFL